MAQQTYKHFDLTVIYFLQLTMTTIKIESNCLEKGNFIRHFNRQGKFEVIEEFQRKNRAEMKIHLRSITLELDAHTLSGLCQYHITQIVTRNLHSKSL